MRRTAPRTLATAVLLVAVACASVGGGDPVVVRTEDYLTNSLSFYDAAMKVHEQFSTKEAITTYRLIEGSKKPFEDAWHALSDGLAKYKIDRDRSQLVRLIDAVAAILKRLSELIPVGTPLPPKPVI